MRFDDKRYFEDLIRRYHAEQTLQEFMYMAKICKNLHPNYIMEIGTRRGGTLRFWYDTLLKFRDMEKDALIIAVDIEHEPQWNYKRTSIPIHFLKMDSLHHKTVERVSEILGDRKLDILFIDGNHTYNAVKQDYENYQGFVRQGGIILFHDINAEHDQVGRFFRENIGSHKSLYIHSKDSQGIGVYYK